MRRLLALLALAAAWAALGAPAGAAGPLAISAPLSGAIVRGKVEVTATDTAPTSSVTFEWSSDGSFWDPFGIDSVPSDGFRAVWDTAGYSGNALIRATDSAGNQTHIRVKVDNLAPSLTLAPGRPSFSPNGDGRRDRVAIRFAASEGVTLKLQLVGPRGLVVQNVATDQAVAARRTLRFVWDGTIYDGARRARDGLYTARASATDAAGNRTVETAEVRVDTRAPIVRALGASQRTAAVVASFSVVDAGDQVFVRPQLLDQYGVAVTTLPSRTVAPGPLALTVPVPEAVAPGAYRVGLLASDEAGNTTNPVPTTGSFLYTHAVRAHVWGRFVGVGRSVALTFDDCYDGGGWAGVLDVLAREKVKATFFCTGQAVLANTALGLRTVREGHAIGSHGWDHANFAALSFDSSVARLIDDRNVWWNLARVVPMPFFRPPYGAYTSTTVAAAGAAGYSAVILWEVDPFDWKRPGVATIVSRVVGRTTPGAIDLMHTLPETAAALPTIIDELRARGYRFLTLPELAALGTPTPGHWRDY
jgi:peptidoglycan/xylan/chitin deacetylase (PgdA/CDA1 family)